MPWQTTPVGQLSTLYLSEIVILINITGGEYLSLLNAQPVLSSVIARAIQDQERISELLHLRVTACSSMYRYTKLEQDVYASLRDNATRARGYILVL